MAITSSPANLHIVECPRDAMQGWKTFIPTEKKIDYINNLLQVGFDTLDCGSFVSPKVIPQMADTSNVISQLSLDGSKTKLLVIVVNGRGAEEAVTHENITYLGFPFSISPTFQQRNANSTLEESLKRVEEIQTLCLKHDKKLVVYLSMGFGNPYGDLYNEEVLLRWAEEMVKLDIKIISLADTVGVATPEQISLALSTLIPKYPEVEFGVHLHSTPANWQQKLEAALSAGCKRFDGALKGIGGCPMAKDDLVGNMNTEWMLSYFEQEKHLQSINKEALQKCIKIAEEIFVS
jgi:hydroxymethylglutaryl-CoA lyase